MRRPLERFLSNRFPKGGFVRSVAVLAGGTAAGQGVVVLAAPVLTRLYTPEDFGVLGIYGSILGILLVLASLRYELAIPLPEDDETAKDLLALCLLITLGMCLAIALGVGWFRGALARHLGAPSLAPYLWFLPLGLLGAGTYQALSYWAVRKRVFPKIALSKLSQGVVQVMTSVGFGLVSSGPAGLVAGDVGGRMSGGGTLGFLALRGSGAVPTRRTRRGLARAAARYRRFPLIASGSSLLNALGLQVPTLFLAALYGPKIAGWYALTQRVIGVPMTLVGSSVAQVYLGEAARLIQGGSGPLRHLYGKTAFRLLLVGGIPLIAIAALSPWLFRWVFGGDWVDAGEYARILALTFAAQFVVVPLSQTLNILQRQELQLLWDAGRLVFVCAAFLLAGSLDWGPRGAVASYSAAMLVAYLALYGLSAQVLRRLSDAGGAGNR